MFKKLTLLVLVSVYTLEATAQDRTIVTSAPTAQQYVDLLFRDEPRIRTRGIQVLQPAPADVTVQPIAAPAPAIVPPVAVPAAPQAPAVVPAVAAPAAAAPQAPVVVPAIVAAPAAPAQPKIVAAPVRFAYNSAAVPTDFEPYLVNLADALKRPEAAGKVVIISGHTDAKGDATYNMALSARRARSVELFLIGHGVGPQQVVSTGRGETQLIPGHEMDDALNRRVEFSVASF